jgi:hypothetical protein
VSERVDGSAESAVQMGAWIALGNNLSIEYDVDVDNDVVRFNFSSMAPDLTVVMTKEALKRCIGAFPEALAELEQDS